MATAADCIACHTTEGGEAYAGGRAFKLPFGTIYSPNITPDPATGIGSWSDGEFLRAMHEGIGKNGEHLYPAFPYTSYSKMTDADALAIKAYLFTLPPVRSAEKKNDLGFPFNQRRFVRFWNILFARSEPFQQQNGRTASWNRGAYLVTAVGHCGECHTPRNLLYGLSGKELAGETMQGWTAWNITADPDHGIGKWSVEDLATYLRDGYAPGRGVASGPMKEAVEHSTSKMKEEDLHAIAVYLKDQKGGGAEKATPLAMDMPAMKMGEALYQDNCAACHRMGGEGIAELFPPIGGNAVVRQRDATTLLRLVLQGSQSAATDHRPTAPAMPGFDWRLNDDQVAAVLTYIRNSWGNAAPAVDGRAVSKLRASLAERTD